MAAPPLVFTQPPIKTLSDGDGDKVADFIETFCKVTKSGVGAKAGTYLELRKWQRTLLRSIFARTEDGRYRHRTALVGLPRKNGKSALGSAVALYGLVMGDEDGREVYSCAGSKDQARIVFSVAKRMVEMDPELASQVKPYQSVLEHKPSGSIYKVLSSDAPMQEGLNPSLVIFDELHVQPDYELWNVMNLAMGARIDPLLLAITTAGVKTGRDGEDSVCYWLYQYIKKIASGEVDDPTTFGAWFGAPQKAPYDQPGTWELANPGYGDLLDPNDFASVVKKTPENEFRTKRLNQWVSSQVAWLPQGAWEARRGSASVHGSLVIGIDGRRDGSSCEVVGVSVDPPHHVEVLGHFAPPPGLADRTDYTVPKEQVKDLLRAMCRERKVAEIAWQEFFWPSDAEQLADEGLPVAVFQQTLTNMGPATQRMYELVTTGGLTHDASPVLERHMGNVQIKTDSRGTRLARTNNSLMAIAAVMALQRAATWAVDPDRPGYYKGQKVEKIRFVW